jgi:outer membrane protein, heavy metal efflux system
MKSIILFLFISVSIYGQTVQGRISLSLDEALNIALKKNFEMVKSQGAIDAAKGRFWTSISLPQPTVSLSHEFVPVSKGLADFQERTLEISQSMEFPTNIFLKGSRSNYELKVTENEMDKTSIEISSRVKRQYKEVLINEKKSALAEDNLKITKDFVDKAELKQKSGEGTKLELITAKMQLKEAAIALESAKNELSFSKNELLSLLNTKEYNGQELILTDSLSFSPLELKYDELLADAQQNSSDLKKFGNMLSIASINKTLAWSSLLPNLSVSYLKQAIPGNNDFYGFSFGVSVPVWFMFDQRGQVQESSANYLIAEEEIKSRKNSLELNLRNAFISFNYGQSQIKSYLYEMLPQAEEIFNLAKLSYNSGEINYVEYLQAKQNLISIRNNYFNSLSNYYSSLSQLENAVGKLIR